MPYYQNNTLKHALCSSSSSFRRGGSEVLERVCSKLGGGLERAVVPVDSSVAPIEGPYATRAGELQDMVLRNVDCANLSAEYSLIDSHFSIIEALKAANNKETDLYFYHSDHLGSSSFLTNANGVVTQHLQYLPYGELFVEQRDYANYYTPYKFSAKEKDEETGYSYFGARYYMPELSIWNSVDVMSDKHPNVSAYAYCNNNPVNLVDPDGNDWFENELTGAVYFNLNMKKGQEGTGAMTGEGWRHMGENGMFSQNEPSPAGGDIQLALKNGGSFSYDQNTNTVNSELMLKDKKEANGFMEKLGYSFVPKDYTYLNDNIETHISEGDGKDVTLNADNGSKINEVINYQYVKSNYFKHSSTLKKGAEIRTPMSINSIRIRSTDINRDYYSSWPSLEGVAKEYFINNIAPNIAEKGIKSIIRLFK